MADILLYDNDEIEDIRKQIRNLENEISQVICEISDVEKVIHEFGARHTIELGPLIKRLLKSRNEKLEKELNGTETKRREFEQAQREYDQYSRDYSEVISEKTFQLSENEKKEIKAKYRKATKLCHPDIVADIFKQQAANIFNELQKAYEMNNLKMVQEILDRLESDRIFEQTNEEPSLLAHLKVDAIALGNKLVQLKKELFDLKQSESFLTITSIENWDTYFQQSKEKLLYEIGELNQP
jgi:hypothetical protein